MDVFELLNTGSRRVVHVGNQLQLRFTEVRCDVRVGQRGTQRARVWLQRECPVTGYPKTFLFDPTAKFGEQRGVLVKCFENLGVDDRWRLSHLLGGIELKVCCRTSGNDGWVDLILLEVFDELTD